MVDFSKFDKLVDNDEIKKQMDAAPEYDDVPAGTYITSIKTMEIKPTKAGDKLMFSASFQIDETVDAPKKQDKRYIFFNRVICGNKATEKWNDGRAIKGVISWLDHFYDEGCGIEFKNYSQFSEDVLEIFQEIGNTIQVKVDYSPDNFNPIEIIDVYDV